MEKSGLATVVLTPTPEFHNDVGIPRQAAIGFPYGRPVGEVDNKEMQLAVLRETLTVLSEAKVPGEIRHLPFEWYQTPKETDWQPPEISPIIKENLEAIKKMKV